MSFAAIGGAHVEDDGALEGTGEREPAVRESEVCEIRERGETPPSTSSLSEGGEERK